METNATYVSATPEGGWRVVGTRVSLDSVVREYWEGRSPEEIVEDFPALSLEQVHGALAFYLRHQDEIDKYLTAQDARWEHLRQESEAKHGSLLQRIRAASQTPSRKGTP
jgi:uncharacterized protein (DUF433 family)